MIIFDSVSKIYGNGTVALDKVSFAVGVGEFMIISGPSGSGKTTLMKLIIKEVDPTHGKIVVDGDDISEIPHKNLHLLRRKVGVIFQDAKLLEGKTVAENVDIVLEIMGLSETEIVKRRNDLLELTGIAHHSSDFPSQLSGGEAQRLGIARALSTQPKVLFADEPTGNLDPATAKDIIGLLQDINTQGTTVLMATHDLDYVKHIKAHRLVLTKGVLTSDSFAHHTSSHHPSKETKKEAPDEDKKT
ncbi:cell division ATP-binding protein FtsE [Candidatus Microgenomates bacterium]|nr:ATP-binding cassette domain-containing protein [Candidatus Microgenomates bacterium CPR3]RIK51221.1 MAG: cell division ATP-binding protein FtsE [Candidatus Microgenomates bacterium]